jgi:hypothetical protein
MVSVLRPGKRILHIPGIGVSTSRRAVSAGGVPSSLLTDIAAYWKLDEAAGANNALDAHANVLTLTQHASPGSAAGKVGTARTFASGSAQYFGRPSETLLQCGGVSITFALWCYPTSLSGGGILIGKDHSSSREYVIDRNTSRARMYIGGSGLAMTDEGALTQNAWNFVTGWWSAVDSTCRIQVNNGTVYAAAGPVTPVDGATEFDIGARTYPGFPDYWNGYIDEVGFWKRLLSDPEKAALYNSGNGITYPFTGT